MLKTLKHLALSAFFGSTPVMAQSVSGQTSEASHLTAQVDSSQFVQHAKKYDSDIKQRDDLKAIFLEKVWGGEDFKNNKNYSLVFNNSTLWCSPDSYLFILDRTSINPNTIPQANFYTNENNFFLTLKDGKIESKKEERIDDVFQRGIDERTKAFLAKYCSPPPQVSLNQNKFQIYSFS